MLKKIKKIYDNIKNLNVSVDKYKDDSIVQSLPALALVNKAIKLFDKNKLDEAENVLNSALEMSGQDALIYKYLGKIAEKKLQFKKAVEYYEKSSGLNFNDKEIWLRLGMCLMYSDSQGRAVEAFENANKITPMNTDVYTGWGMALMKQKKYAQARDRFNFAAQISKYNFTAILLSAVMEMRLEEYSLAEDKLGFLVKVAPNESSLYEYSHLKLIQSKYEEAEIYARKTLDYNKKMLPAYFILGEVYSILKDYGRVEETFKTALEYDLESAVLYFEWGKALVRLYDFAGAREKFNLALSAEEGYKAAKIGLVLVFAYENNFELLDEYLDRNLDNVYIQEAFGLKKFFEGEYENALELFKKALKTDKNQTYLYYDLAKTYAVMKNNDKTAEYFDKFVDLSPKYTKGFIEYSRWLINISNYEEARRKLEKAQKLEPDNIEVLNLLFFVKYTLVKNNVSEYNIKDAISIANRAVSLGKFDYEPQKLELENLLKDLG